MPRGYRESVVDLARKASRYLANLDGPRTVLWCYLVWYAVVAARYFDPSPSLWGASLGLSGVIGFALLLNAGWPRAPLARWQRVRFFLTPFCVSSFAALVKGRGFILVFSRDPKDLVLGASGCAALLALRRWSRRRERVTVAP